MKKALFYILSLTWGLPMTLIGLIAALFLIVVGYKPKRFGWCYYFEVGKTWGGANLGIIFIACKGLSNNIKSHECGHAIQNCVWGPLMPFVICIPSAIRYWMRSFQFYQGKELKPYDSIWFEGQATRWGKIMIERYSV
jgi:hypothetical protein